MPTAFEIFKTMLLEEAGDAMGRWGYRLQDDAIQISSGLYRWVKMLEGDALALIDVQLLFYSEGGPSRVGVNVWRSDQAHEKINLGVWLNDQGLMTQADRLGWWEFASARELRETLREMVAGLNRVEVGDLKLDVGKEDV